MTSNVVSEEILAENAAARWDRESWVAPHLDAVLTRARRISGKRFRSRLVELSARLVLAERGLDLTSEVGARVMEAGLAIEEIHLGSLVVDDIQDGSDVRRGEPALHQQVGIPLALNAGNWLYFSALKNLMRIPWNAVCECEAVGLAIEAMLQAHEGQAIDLGVDITKVRDTEVPEVVAASGYRKTGALVGAAFGLGFLAAHADGEFNRSMYQKFQQFGTSWGVCLQMFDDLGALKQSLEGQTPREKLFEDLINCRPSFFWTMVARLMPREKFPEHRSVIDAFVAELSNTEDKHLDFATIQRWPSFIAFSEILNQHQLFEAGMRFAKQNTDIALSGLVSALNDRASRSHEAQEILNKEIRAIEKINEDLSLAYLGETK